MRAKVLTSRVKVTFIQQIGFCFHFMNFVLKRENTYKLPSFLNYNC